MRARSGMVGLILLLVGTGILLLQSPAEPSLELRIAPNETNSAAWDLALYGSSVTGTYTFLSATGFPLAAESPRAVRLGAAGSVPFTVAMSNADRGFFRARLSSTEDFDGDGVANLEEFQRSIDPENPDTDGDGMLDGEELGHGFNPLVHDETVDEDGDGLSVEHETVHDTDQGNADSDGDGVVDGSDANPGAAADGDGDGLPDDWERNWFGDLDETGAGDFDEDGSDNLAEWRQGADPTRRNQADAGNEAQLTVFMPVE